MLLEALSHRIELRRWRQAIEQLIHLVDGKHDRARRRRVASAGLKRLARLVQVGPDLRLQ